VNTSGFGGPVPHMPELKAIDAYFNNQMTGLQGAVAVLQVPGQIDVTNSGWDRQCINQCIQGTTLYQRIGQKIVMKRFVMKLVFSQIPNGGAAQTNDGGFYRVLVVYDAQPNATSVTAANLAASVLKDNTEITSPLNLDNRERYKVILDKIGYLGAKTFSAAGLVTASNTSEQWQSACNKYKKTLNLDTIFNSGNAGTIGDIQTGALYVLYGTSISQSLAAPANCVGVAGYTRIRFYDS